MPDLNEIERGQLCQSTIESLYEATGGLRQFPSLLKKVIATRAWERRTVHGKVVELGSLRELITAKPVSGWGEDPSKVEAVIRDDPEALAAFREAMKHQGERPNLDDNVIEVERSPVGNSRAYSISRVQRECDPDTVAAVMSGEMSPNAALVRAGVRENRQVYIPRDPAAAVKKLRAQFGDDFLEGMRRALGGR
jgi:hypothetical protein